MPRITLPNGGWAKLRDPTQLSERRRRPLRTSGVREDSDSAFMVGYEDTLLVAFVEGWSLPLPLPEVDRDSLLELDGITFDTLVREALALLPATVLDTAPGPGGAPTAPFAPSNGSESQPQAVGISTTP